MFASKSGITHLTFNKHFGQCNNNNENNNNNVYFSPALDGCSQAHIHTCSNIHKYKISHDMSGPCV